MTHVLKALLRVLCLPAFAAAQVDRATLNRAVSDPSGDAVPKAKVTANFGLRGANIASATVSTITTLAGDPRIMQFSVRVDF